MAPALSGADISGTWNMDWNTEGGMRYTDWEVSQDGESLTVKTDGQVLKGTLKDGKVILEGKYHASEAGYSSTLRIDGTVSDGEMKGKATWDQYAMTFTGKRSK